MIESGARAETQAWLPRWLTANRQSIENAGIMQTAIADLRLARISRRWNAADAWCV